MRPNETLTVYIDFISKLPVMISRPSALQYECVDVAYINVTVIPSENETDVYLETELSGPEPYMVSRYADIKELSLEPWKDVEHSFMIDVSSLPNGNYYFRATLKKGFLPLKEDGLVFEIKCPTRYIILNADAVLLILVAGVVMLVAYVIVRFRRKRGFERSIEELRNRLRELGINNNKKLGQ